MSHLVNSENLTHAIEAVATPVLVKTLYPTAETVVADVIAAKPNYNIDPTGKIDASNAIQQAIDACSAQGGGTVFLPAGEYLCEHTLTVKPFVTLLGEWQSPDTVKNGAYGTILLASVDSLESELPAFITLTGSGGVSGLTVFYPEQTNLDAVKPYPYTFYIPGDSSSISGSYMLQTISNCTVLNGYNGIGATFTGVHEMLTIENVYGTFLNNGATAYNQADVGTWKNLFLKNDYWLNAGERFAAPDKSKLDAYTQAHTKALVLGDLEWTQFNNIEIADCDTGVQIVKGKRIEFAGSFYNMKIERCRFGFVADSIDKRWGAAITDCSIEAHDYAVINDSKGFLKFSGCTITGEVFGKKIIITEREIPKTNIDYKKTHAHPTQRLYLYADAEKVSDGKTDISTNLQALLEEAGKTGGVAYLPAGYYRLNQPISVPAGVELRGAGTLPVRGQHNASGGTVLLSYYGKDTSPNTSPALITLNGKNAGLSGVQILYPDNPYRTDTTPAEHISTAYAVKGASDGVYLVNSAIAGTSHGVDFFGADNHFIKKVLTGVYENAFHIGNSTGGHMEGCLQNGTVLLRQNADIFGYFPSKWVTDENAYTWFFSDTRNGLDYIVMDNAKKETIHSTFAYGAARFCRASESDAILVSIGADNIGDKTPMIDAVDSNLTILNMLRYNGVSFAVLGGKLDIYNRLTIGKPKETDVLGGEKT